MIPALLIANLLLLLLLGLAVAKIDRLYQKHRHRRLLWRVPAKVAVEPLPEVDPRFAQGQFGTRRETEVKLIGGFAYSGTDTYEAWILAVLAQGAHRLFEFGTSCGSSPLTRSSSNCSAI